MGRGSVKTGAMETESYRVVRGRKKRIFLVGNDEGGGVYRGWSAQGGRQQNGTSL